ncbi:hypothetical protein SAMD00019534_049150 [Acytostelium subglobosum LB1]|uniref:hypothetical protein n=1 Tax=Acytostelium subglobosum LB1 TaxID=1410327 RepID=UPI000644C1A5|nr:hypothetical protein SAMD00019534_049150 [Acytostelium subglobosum LB1]GAM21740.1 hypothetical protein SAMD00019534_049150 [Acytostelium subglobosum LB1]|eukprot:XP_012754840.1 hypothetical protein SAMD00019534_049150 [Acytostelium subglobosum LB1]
MPGSLPHHLINIYFNNSFNQVLEPNTFPPTVKTISFGTGFNQTLNGVLPISLLHLLINVNNIDYNHDLINLPAGLLELALPKSFVNRALNCPSLERLEVYSYIPISHQFPNLQGLTINRVDQNCNFEVVTSTQFPKLAELLIKEGVEMDLDISHLPWTTLKKVNMFQSIFFTYPKILPFKFPLGLEKLAVGGYDFVAAPLGSLPSSINSLKLWDVKNIRLGDIPSSVTKLVIEKYDQSFDVKMLPISLSKFVISTLPNQIDIVRQLPDTIRKFEILTHFKLIRVSNQLYFRQPHDDEDQLGQTPYGFQTKSTLDSIIQSIEPPPIRTDISTLLS